MSQYRHDKVQLVLRPFLLAALKGAELEAKNVAALASTPTGHILAFLTWHLAEVVYKMCENLPSDHPLRDFYRDMRDQYDDFLKHPDKVEHLFTGSFDPPSSHVETSEEVHKESAPTTSPTRVTLEDLSTRYGDPVLEDGPPKMAVTTSLASEGSPVSGAEIPKSDVSVSNDTDGGPTTGSSSGNEDPVEKAINKGKKRSVK